jgi:hypothetical protein
MNHIKFRPWEGENYSRAPFGKKVLILGESHYDWDPDRKVADNPDVTNELIQEQIDGYFKAFWTHIAVIFLNHKPDLNAKRQFWQSVAFYNYVQTSAGNGPRVRPTPQMFQDSEPAFFEVLELLKPEVVIVLGYGLWKYLPNQTEDVAIETKTGQIYTHSYSYPGGKCVACCIRHPSSGFNGRDWHHRVMDIISK